MRFWDPHGQAYLETVCEGLAETGLIDFLRLGVQRTWRINRERHEPEEAYDDNTTLGLTSARNLSNRLYKEGRESAELRAAGIETLIKSGATVMRAPQGDVRTMKAPASRGRGQLTTDFEWSENEGRAEAATRNRNAYNPPSRRHEMEPLLEITQPDAAEAVTRCRDFFVVWGADLRSGLTAGWLGLPTIGPQPWIALTQIWWDQAPGRSTEDTTRDQPSGDGATFGDKRAALPEIALKPRRQEGSSDQ